MSQAKKAGCSHSAILKQINIKLTGRKTKTYLKKGEQGPGITTVLTGLWSKAMSIVWSRDRIQVQSFLKSRVTFSQSVKLCDAMSSANDDPKTALHLLEHFRTRYASLDWQSSFI